MLLHSDKQFVFEESLSISLFLKLDHDLYCRGYSRILLCCKVILSVKVLSGLLEQFTRYFKFHIFQGNLFTLGTGWLTSVKLFRNATNSWQPVIKMVQISNRIWPAIFWNLWDSWSDFFFARCRRWGRRCRKDWTRRQTAQCAITVHIIHCSVDKYIIPKSRTSVRKNREIIKPRRPKRRTDWLVSYH